MRVINVSLNELETKLLMIGFQGENEITQVRIDAAEILTDYPTATPTLIVKPLFGFAYPVIVTKEGTDVVWEIDNSVLSFHGDGEIQLTFTQGTVIAKSYVGRIRIKRSLAVNGETPDPIETWETAATAKLAEVDAQISELEGMVDAAEAAKDEAQDIVDDAAADIQAAGATQIAAVEAKGRETRESIPDDYTTLANTVNSHSDEIDDIGSDVTDLKSALTTRTDSLIKLATMEYAGWLTTSGEIRARQNSLMSYDPIKITGSKIVYRAKMGNGVGTICFYNSADTFISCVTYDQSVIQFGIADIPENAVYYRACLFYPNDDPWQYIGEIYDYDAFLSAFNSIKTNSDVIALKLDKGVDQPFSVTGKYIDLNGVAQTYANANVTEYIYCKGLKTVDYKLKLSNAYYTIAFYDANMGLIADGSIKGTTSSASGGDVVLTAAIPATAVYFRATCWAPSTEEYFIKLNYEISDLIKKSPEMTYLYGDSIFRPFAFSGKTALVFGDSITDGVANEGSGNYNVFNNSYIGLFADHAGLTLTNKAVSGSCITYASGEAIQSIYSVLTNTSTPADFIIISGGTNDYNTGKPIGEWGDSVSTTFYGALKLICDYLAQNYPNSTVIFITPINVTKDFNGIPRETLNLYRNAIFEVATYYGYNVVNGIDMIPVTGTEGYDDTMINHIDGCHPTARGHKMYARDLSMKLC